MKLNRLTIKNFKGIENLMLEPKGADMEIFGKNGTGKTTIYDAYTWCLFGKSGDGSSIEGQIKRRDADGKTATDGGVDHVVEIELDKDDGERMSLRRCYREVWSKKRGQAQAEFTGHTTDYAVNGVPVSKREFTDYVGRIGSEDAFRLLSMPLHFCSKLHWSERRKLLLQICGDVSDEDVIASNAQLAALPKLLGGKSFDELRKVIAARRKEINKELEKIPARIDELEGQMPDTAGLQTRGTLEIEIASLQKQRDDLQRRIVRIENGGEIAAKKKAIAGIEAQQIRIKARLDAAQQSGAGAKERILKDMEALKMSLEKQIETLCGRAEILLAAIEAAQKKMTALRERYFSRRQIAFVSPVADICPTCGQPLPAEKKAEAEAKALEQFNLKRSAALTEINEAGKAEKKKAETDQKMLDDLTADIAGKQIKLDALRPKIEEAAADLSSVEPVQPENDPEYQALTAKKDALLEEIAALKNDAAAELRKLQSEITVFGSDIAARQSKIAALDQCETMRRRIKELKAREADLGKEYNAIEQQLFLTEEFIRSKVALLEEKINSKFKYVRFKLFDVKINGALEECCEAMIGGVPFADGLNTGSRMKAGMDIVNVLSVHYGLNLPIWIDNCESYTELIQTDSQLITLYADSNHENIDVNLKLEESAS